MHSLRFPKTLTVELPELQREALHQICDREKHRSPADLLEAILALGLASKLASFPPEGGEADACDVGDTPLPASIQFVLNEEQSGRVFRILKGRTARTPEELAGWLLEWGLEAFEASCRITEPVDDENIAGEV